MVDCVSSHRWLRLLTVLFRIKTLYMVLKIATSILLIFVYLLFTLLIFGKGEFKHKTLGAWIT